MPQTLIIPDIHEDMSKLRHIEEVFIPQADRVIMLGDFWDSFDMRSPTHLITKWVKDHIHDDKYEFCWGNHDAQYGFRHPAFKCSGYRPQTDTLLSAEMTLAEWRKFKVYTKVGNFVVSHAGFHPKTIDLMADDEVDAALDLAFTGAFHRMWNAGTEVGGRGIGGPTWLRWEGDYERFIPLEFPQIVGHTIGRAVRTKAHENGTISYCLDTKLDYVMWTDGKDVEIVRVGNLPAKRKVEV